MAKDTVIIEFVGIPACGKSTLCDAIKHYEIEHHKKAYVWNDMTKSFKRASVKEIIGSISVPQLLRYCSLFRSISVEKGYRYYAYWFALKISILYRYARKYLDADLVLVDHGYYQQAVSMQCGNDIALNQSFLNQFMKTMKSETEIDYLVECSLDYKIAMQRMLHRKRDGEGRLDKDTNREKLEIMYIIEEQNFSTILDCVKNIESVRRFVMVDMNKTTDELRDYILDMLRGGCDKD